MYVFFVLFEYSHVYQNAFEDSFSNTSPEIYWNSVWLTGYRAVGRMLHIRIVRLTVHCSMLFVLTTDCY